jgi:omega-hydroxypalmitate O-feruloyl transferase
VSHSLFDGPASYDFLCAWASNSAIMKGKGGLDQLQQPVHERGKLLVGNFLQAPNILTTKSSKSLNSPTRAAAIDHLYQLIMQAAAADHHNLSDVGCSSQKSFLLRTFHLSSAMIESLKRKVSGKRGGSFSCSSFEVVAAHLWKVSFSIG